MTLCLQTQARRLPAFRPTALSASEYRGEFDVERVILGTSVGVPMDSWPVKACRNAGWARRQRAASRREARSDVSSVLSALLKARLRTWRPIFKIGCKPR